MFYMPSLEQLLTPLKKVVSEAFILLSCYIVIQNSQHRRVQGVCRTLILSFSMPSNDILLVLIKRSKPKKTF